MFKWCCWCFYASAFRRRRHYVFGLSVRLSLRRSVRSLKYPLLTCTWVRWSTRPTVTVLRHVRQSPVNCVFSKTNPSGEVSGHMPENAWREWPEILHADQGWGQIRFIKYKYKYKYIFFRSFKYKYKYKYTGKNLIKYKYKYKYSSSNTNTNTNTQWGRDKIAAIL